MERPPIIVDSHVHFWDVKRFRYSWLASIPALNRSFLPEDFALESNGENVKKLIFVESGCDPLQGLAAVDWAVELAKTESRLKAIVAHAALEKGLAASAELEALAKRPLVKGVRRLLQDETDSAFCLRPDFIVGVQLLADFGFTFDLCVRHNQLRNVVELVRRVPQVTFVLDHCGKPDVRGGKVEPWATDLRALASLPNVVCKLSGLTTEANWSKWQAKDLEEYFRSVLKFFGFDRILFGGDWPVATLATNYGRWVETVQDMVSSASDADRLKLFQTNAERIYRV